MRLRHLLQLVVVVSSVLVCRTANAATAATVHVKVNTTALVGSAGGPFAVVFVLTDGSGIGNGSSAVTISDVDFGGGFGAGSPAVLGGVAGSLKDGASLTDNSVLTLMSEVFTPGSMLRFTLTLNSAEDAETPDRLGFLILDGSGTPIPTLSPAADFFVGIDLGPQGASPELFSSDGARTSLGGTITPEVVGDAAPPTLSLPADLVFEATSASGTTVFYTATAVDNVDGPITPVCTPLSGASFAMTTTTVDCSATDLAGNSSTGSFVVTVRDTTPPTITAQRSPNPNQSGWNNSAVSVSFSCSDVASGLAAGSPPAPTIVAIEGVGQNVTGTCADAAGNSVVESVQNINVDLTLPTVARPTSLIVPQAILSGAVVNYSAPAVTETLSGIASAACLPESGAVFPVGTTEVRCTAIDRAGNIGSASFTVTVVPSADSRMFGLGLISRSALHDHFAFRVTQLRNQDSGRLEYWTNDPRRCGPDDDPGPAQNGDHESDYGRDRHSPTSHFEATFMNVVFFDDPSLAPAAWPMPTLDTVRIYGVGKWNGRPGYTFEASATDQGEPGRGRDTFALTIKDPGGNVVANVSGILAAGNIQSMRISR